MVFVLKRPTWEFVARPFQLAALEALRGAASSEETSGGGGGTASSLATAFATHANAHVELFAQVSLGVFRAPE